MAALDLGFVKLEGFEWDKGNLEHIKMHNVDYRECEEVFSNKPLLISRDKTHSQVEERFQVLGRTNNHRLLYLVFTIRTKNIRVFSARDQNRKEKTRLNERVKNEKA